MSRHYLVSKASSRLIVLRLDDFQIVISHCFVVFLHNVRNTSHLDGWIAGINLINLQLQVICYWHMQFLNGFFSTAETTLVNIYVGGIEEAKDTHQITQ